MDESTALVPADSVAQLVAPLTRRQKKLILLVAMGADEKAARALVPVGRKSFWTWKKDSDFMAALTVAQSANAVERANAIAMYFKDELPTVMAQIASVATMPWAWSEKDAVKTKRWAIELLLRLVGVESKEASGKRADYLFEKAIINIQQQAEE